MINIKINDMSHCEVTRERDPNDRWSGEDTYTSHNIESFNVIDDDDYCDISVGVDIENGKDYYLLYAIYSTGDSFSRYEGEITLIDLYQNREFAEANRKVLTDHLKIESGKKEYIATLLLEDGRAYPFHVPWKGYFEHLNEICVERISTSRKDSWRM